MHEFEPNVHGKCKVIVGGRNARYCHERADFLPHVRFREMEEEHARRIPFVSFGVVVNDDKLDELVVYFPANGECTEEMRQFVASAIREKLDRL
jgi:hypothetical protein